MCAPQERRPRAPIVKARCALRVSFFVLTALMGGAPAYAAALLRLPPPLPVLRRDEKLHKEIESLESQWRQAYLTNNVAAFENLLADDYLGITANGTLETKADAVALRRSGSVKISGLQPRDTKIHVYGNTAVVTSRVDLTGTSGDHDISGVYRYTRVYNRRDGQWKVVSFEASRLTPGRKR